MLALGVILILVAAAVFGGVIIGGANDTARFDIGFVDATMSTLSVFLVGASTMLVLIAGLLLVRAGARRANRRRKDSRELARLSKKLEHRDAGARTTGEGTTTQGPTS